MSADLRPIELRNSKLLDPIRSRIVSLGTVGGLDGGIVGTTVSLGEDDGTSDTEGTMDKVGTLDGTRVCDGCMDEVGLTDGAVDSSNCQPSDPESPI